MSVGGKWLIRILQLSLLVTLAACSASARPQSRELLDENSGSTLLIVRRPIVFARVRTDAAANARDYATVVAVGEDRSGKLSLWLIVHRWSTVDPRFGGAPIAGSGPLHLLADDRELTLEPVAPAPAFVQRRDVLFAPHAGGAPSAGYSVTAEQLRFIASSRALSLRFDTDPLPIPYTLWEDGRPALGAWLTDAHLR